MDMTIYFEKYNQLKSIPSQFIFVAISILIITYFVSKKFGKKHRMVDEFATICTFLMAFLLTGVTLAYTTYEDYFKVKPFIQNVQKQINQELNVKLTYQQTEELLTNQPIWANKLTQNDFEK